MSYFKIGVAVAIGAIAGFAIGYFIGKKHGIAEEKTTQEVKKFVDELNADLEKLHQDTTEVKEDASNEYAENLEYIKQIKAEIAEESQESNPSTDKKYDEDYIMELADKALEISDKARLVSEISEDPYIVSTFSKVSKKCKAYATVISEREGILEANVNAFNGYLEFMDTFNYDGTMNDVISNKKDEVMDNDQVVKHENFLEEEKEAERMAKIDNRDPYIISYDDYYDSGYNHYDKIELFYYKLDDTVCDDNDAIIEDPDETLGWDFFEELEKYQTVYVRNEPLYSQFKITGLDRSYEEDVLGWIGTNKERAVWRMKRGQKIEK